MYAKDTVDVTGPAVSLETLGDSPPFPPSLGDAGVDQWCNLADGAPTNPAIFSEKGFLAVPNLHGCRGEK